MLISVIMVFTNLLCSMVAGILFAFAVVVMPGLKRLNDGEFLCAFIAIDDVIQNKQFLFMLVWIGSIFSLVFASVLGSASFEPMGQSLIYSALIIFILGVQLPTILVNIPLNNYIQSLNVEGLTDSAKRSARSNFESRWVLWNRIRAFFAINVTVILLVLLFCY